MRVTDDRAAFALRAAGADEPDGRTIEGLAVPYGVPVTGPTREYGEAAESFAPGSFAAAIRARGSRPVPILDDHGGTVVGTASVTETPEGLRFAGRLLTSQAARDFGERVAAGADGVSIEFLPGTVRRSGRAVVHTAVRVIGAIAGAYAGAYPAAMAAVRTLEDAAVTDQIETTTTELVAPDPTPAIRAAVTELGRELRESLTAGMRPAGADPWAEWRAYRTIGELWSAANGGQAAARGLMSRALADQITSENPGVTTPGVVGDVRGIFAKSRPAITAFGRTPLEGSGMSVLYPYSNAASTLGAIVGEQLTQKSEVVSVDTPILLGNAPVKTYAGGSDLSVQAVKRSSPSFIEAYSRILLMAYAAVTDGAFIDLIEGTGGTQTVALTWGTATAQQLFSAVALASVMTQDRTGEPAAFGLASASVYSTIAGLLSAYSSPIVAGPTEAVAGRNALVVSGVPIYYQPNVNADRLIVSSGPCAEWHEDGPEFLSADDVAKLGRDVAIFGLGAAEVGIPAGIIFVGA